MATMTGANTTQLKQLLTKLPDVVADKVSRDAVKAGATPICESAKQKAPKESGLLAESMDVKVVQFKDSGTAVAIIGPRSDFVGEYNGEVRKPSKYAHLVELGTADLPPQPFLRPAYDENIDSSVQIMKDKLAQGVESEAAKLAGGAA